jgi:hypothetical protein
MADSKLDETSIVNERPKLSDYAYNAVERVLAHTYLTLATSNETKEVFEKTKEIAQKWNDDGAVIDLIGNLKTLSASAQAKEDKESEVGIGLQMQELSAKLEKSDNLKETLREGGLLGQLVGAQLLKQTQYDPNLLTDPIILAGTDFVIDCLNQEHSLDLQRTPEEQKNFAPFIQGTVSAIAELSSFSAATKELQTSNQSNP